MKIVGEESAANIKPVVKDLYKQEAGRTVHREKQSAEEDNVQLSPRAKEFHRIKDVLEGIPEIREEKVAALKDSIEKGTYSPDTNKAAANMITESIIDLFV